jgi:hypothetical protein
MTKSTIRGSWPGLPTDDFYLVNETYTGRSTPRGVSIYHEWIEQLSKAKPGQAAIRCKTHKLGRTFTHALSRHLVRVGKEKKLRAVTQTDGDGMKVWLVER